MAVVIRALAHCAPSFRRSGSGTPSRLRTLASIVLHTFRRSFSSSWRQTCTHGTVPFCRRPSAYRAGTRTVLRKDSGTQERVHRPLGRRSSCHPFRVSPPHRGGDFEGQANTLPPTL